MAKPGSSFVPRVGRALLVVAVASAVAIAPVASSTPAGAATPARDGGVVTTAAAFTLTLTPFKSGFANPVFLTSAHDGSGRLFVIEKGGRIKVIMADGAVLPTPLLDLSGRVSTGSEQGLLGLAFHPSFRTNGKFYVDFTNLAGDTVINEYRLSPLGSNRVTLRAVGSSRSPSRLPTTTAAISRSVLTGSSTSAWATAVRGATQETAPRA